MSDNAAWGDRIVEWARRFHVEYEYQAKRFGWQSQTPVDFDELPEANKQTMLGTVAAVMGSEVYPREREIESLRAEVTRLESLISAPRECPTDHANLLAAYEALDRERANVRIDFMPHWTCPRCGTPLSTPKEKE